MYGLRVMGYISTVLSVLVHIGEYRYLMIVYEECNLLPIFQCTILEIAKDTGTRMIYRQYTYSGALLSVQYIRVYRVLPVLVQVYTV